MNKCLLAVLLPIFVAWACLLVHLSTTITMLCVLLTIIPSIILIFKGCIQMKIKEFYKENN